MSTSSTQPVKREYDESAWPVAHHGVAPTTIGTGSIDVGLGAGPLGQDARLTDYGSWLLRPYGRSAHW